MQDHDRLNLSAGIASVAVALVLTALKLWALAVTGALSVAASLVDSGLDLMVSAAGLVAILYAAKPADEDHAFGHTSAEDLAALGQALFIFASAVVIAVAAARRLVADDAPVTLDAEGAGIAVMVFASLVTIGLVLWQRRVAARTGNQVVAADSLHYSGDLILNLGAIVALIASAGLGLANIDSTVALGAAAFMGFGALRIGKHAWDALMDRRADPALIADIGAHRHELSRRPRLARPAHPPRRQPGVRQPAYRARRLADPGRGPCHRRRAAPGAPQGASATATSSSMPIRSACSGIPTIPAADERRPERLPCAAG